MTVINGSRGATALVGMAGFVVGAEELIGEEWWLYVETTADLVGCPGCGTRAVGHGRARTAVGDLPIAGRATVLVFARRRWRCPDVGCEVNTWSEHVDAIAPRASLTRRARERMALMVNVEEDSIAGVAAEFGVGWHTANAAVAEFTDPVIDDESRLEGVVALGVDEKRFTNAGPQKRTTFTTQVVDLDRRRLLDVIEGRSKSVLADWLGARPTEWLAGIRVATLDPSAGYRRALLEHLPNATLVVDCFHGVKLGNDTVDDVRRRVQQETTGHRGHKGDPLYGIRRPLLVAYERLSEDRLAKIFAALNAGDPDGHVGAAWCAKELLREVWHAVDLAHARRRLIEFFQFCADAEVPELTRLACTVDRWSIEILNYHRTFRASNGKVENLHMLAEKIRRTAHGFTNYHNYRRRLLGRHGVQWHTAPTARIRGRQPRLIA